MRSWNSSDFLQAAEFIRQVASCWKQPNPSHADVTYHKGWNRCSLVNRDRQKSTREAALGADEKTEQNHSKLAVPAPTSFPPAASPLQGPGHLRPWVWFVGFVSTTITALTWVISVVPWAMGRVWSWKDFWCQTLQLNWRHSFPLMQLVICVSFLPSLCI